MDFDPRDYDSRDDERFGPDRERGGRDGSGGTDDNKSKAARRLALTRTQLYVRLLEYGIAVSETSSR